MPIRHKRRAQRSHQGAAEWALILAFNDLVLAMEFFDTHCHLNTRYLNEDESPAEIIARARDNGVTRLTVIGCGPTMEETREAVAIADAFEGVYATVGLHPHESIHMTDTMLEELRALAAHPKVVAIGEMGLDYHYDHSPRDVQQAAFRAQLQLADDVGKPIVIHNRNSDEDCIKILNEHYEGRTARGVIHCFTSSEALATRAIELGFHLGFTGVITFKNAQNVRDILRNTPHDRVVVETDAPFLAPIPFRGKTNEPAYVRFTAETVASTLGLTIEETAALTTANARALYGV